MERQGLSYFGFSQVLLKVPSAEHEIGWMRTAFESSRCSSFYFGIDWKVELGTVNTFFMSPSGEKYFLSTTNRNFVIKESLISANFLLEAEMVQKQLPRLLDFCIVAKCFFTHNIFAYSVYVQQDITVSLKEFCEYHELSNGNINFVCDKILSALHFLHSNNVIHGSIQQSSIFINGNNVRVGDFTFSCTKSVAPCVSKRFNVFPHNIDSVKKNPLSSKTDIWSFGIVYAQLVKKNIFAPFVTFIALPNLEEQIECFTTDRSIQQNFVTCNFNEDQQQLLSLVLCKNPLRRQTADVVKNHPIFMLKKALF